MFRFLMTMTSSSWVGTSAPKFPGKICTVLPYVCGTLGVNNKLSSCHFPVPE